MSSLAALIEGGTWPSVPGPRVPSRSEYSGIYRSAWQVRIWGVIQQAVLNTADGPCVGKQLGADAGVEFNRTRHRETSASQSLCLHAEDVGEGPFQCSEQAEVKTLCNRKDCFIYPAVVFRRYS